MKPPLPHSESAVPRTPHAQLEIARAIRTLMTPDDDEPLRRRRAELGAIRGELEAIKRDFLKASEECLALVKAELRAAAAKKYNPDQPRVSAGNRDGGQWTSGSKGGDAASSDVAGQFSETRSRYALLENPPGGTQTDATDGTTASAAQRYAQDIPPGSLDSAFGSQPSGKISAYDIPADNPKHPVPFVDRDNNPILDAQGKPLLRPDDLPPEKYVNEGVAYDFKDRLAAAQGNAVKEYLAWADLAIQLSNMKHGGPWDAESMQGQRIPEYRDYANLVIGLYFAAAGIKFEDGMWFADTYAKYSSSFHEPMDEIYTHLPKRDVLDMKMGYDLYGSGRIAAGR
jgi:hypothetical protein